MKLSMWVLSRTFWATGLLGIAVSMAPAAAQAKQPAAAAESLPLCGKCLNPAVFSKSGIGTGHAVVKARVTLQDARDHCEQWSMEEHPDCDKQAKETLKEENGKVYTATADCVHGKITDANGENFVYVGLWPKSGNSFQDRYLAGKTRWKWGPGSDGDTGKIVGEDGPTNAFMVDTTSKILCPNGIGGTGKH